MKKITNRRPSREVGRHARTIAAFFNLSAAKLISILILVMCGTAVDAYSQNEPIEIDYGKIVDRSPYTHSGQTVGQVLEILKNQPPSDFSSLSPVSIDLAAFDVEAEQQKIRESAVEIERQFRRGRITDSTRYLKIMELEVRAIYLSEISRRKSLNALIEPFLEPYAFLLQDALESENPAQLKNPLTEVADLFPYGEKQPAWANLLKTRRFFALSDGKGYARVFLPSRKSLQGNLSAQKAYSENYGAVRHILNWLRESTPGGQLSVDIYAYENDLQEQILSLGKTVHNLKINEKLPPPPSTIPLDLKSIEEFLAKGLTLEGAYLNDEGTLVLYGSKSPVAPTLEGQPLELSDFAAAYRAVSHAGYNEPYISLDASPFPEQVNVNFGGRLADTRIGWVTLRSDMLFKTLSTGANPITGENLTDEIRKSLPTFQTQYERMFSNPKKQRSVEESTRFWFYPNDEAVTISRDEKFISLSKPRFIGQAVREDMTGERTVEIKTPTWTTNTLAHFNVAANYNTLSKQFAELRELDEVGRLLALAAWLKEKQSAGLKLDLDVLLNVELPQAGTPRRNSQLIAGFLFRNKRVKNYFNLSPIVDDILLQRQSENKATLKRLGEYGLIPVNSEDLFDLVGKKYDTELAKSGITNEEMKVIDAEDFSGSWMVVGGIDLKLNTSIKKAKKIPPSAESFYQSLKTSSPETGLPKTPTQRTFRAKVKNIVDVRPAPNPLPKPHQAGEVKQTGAVGSKQIATAKREIVEYKPITEKVKWTRSAPENSFDKQSSKTVFYGGDGKPETFARTEDGNQFYYKLGKSGDGRIVAENAVLAKDNEVALISGLRQKGDSDLQIWRSLPDATDIAAFEKMPDGKLAVLRETNDVFRLTLHDAAENKVTATFEGDAAIAEMNKAVRLKLEAASDGEAAFVQAAFEGDSFTLSVGKDRKQFSREEIFKALDEPDSAAAKSFDAMFEGQRDFIVYRDALTRRAERLGGSLRKSRLDDPMEFVAILREKFPNKRVYLDDEVDVAKENRKAIGLLTRPADVGMLAPEESFPIKDHGLIKTIKKDWKTAGGEVLENVLAQPDAMRKLPNVLLLSGHNDANLTAYLVSLGEAGLLNSKVLFLQTCYAAENPNLNNHLIQKYKPKAVFIHTETISPVALEYVLTEFSRLLKTAETTGKPIHPLDLMEQSIKLSLANEDATPFIKREIEKLRRGTFQISWINRAKQLKQAE